jgi:mannitol/fructose-specific phosphotransferase system IIA component (Ntr-type)
MKITPLLRPDFITLDLKSQTRLDVLHEMTQLVKGHPYMKDFAAFCRAVHEREAMGCTALTGHDIAIPHARTDQVADILLGVGCSQTGALFEGKEPQIVKLVFLVGTPKKMVMEYLQLLGSLAKLLKEEAFRSALLSARSADEFIGLFQQQENHGR